jgi:hypothetical protein
MNKKMNKENNNAPFKAEDVDWNELAAIGILKDELEMAGELDTLLRGDKTGVIPLSLVLLGVDVVMDATLQLVRKGEAPLLEIQGVTPLGR